MHKNVEKTLPGLVTCLVLIASSASLRAAPPNIEHSEFSEFQSRWQDAAKSLQVPGWAVVAVREDKVVMLDAGGVRNVDAGEPVTPETMFYIASCTKPYTAMAAVALADNDRINLDAPVKTYLPQLALSDASLTETITVRDLICHRYGINSEPIVFNDAYSGLITDDLYFRLLKDAHIAGRVDYTNIHFTLAGRVLSAVTGKDWREVLRERVFDPAGMTRTSGFANKMYKDPNAALPHIYDGQWKPSHIMKTDRTMHAAGGLGTTAIDLGRWIRLNLNHGEIDGKSVIRKASAQEMMNYQSRLDKPDGSIRIIKGYGLGWQLGDYRDKSKLIAHGGGYVGTAAYIAMLPEKNFGAAVLANCGDEGNAFCAILMIDMFDKVLGIQDSEDLLPSYKKMAEKYRQRRAMTHKGTREMTEANCSLSAESYSGEYQNEDLGLLRLEVKDNQLVGAIGDLPIEIFWTGRDQCDVFTLPHRSFASKFEIHDGRVVAIDLEGKRFIRE